MRRKTIAGYEVIEQLGEGGMGVVYLARDATLDRKLAVKVLRPESLGPEGRERFLHEARAGSRINHPNIVTVYAAGEDDGDLYIAMELLEGKTLTQLIEEGPVPWEQAVSWIIDILNALDRLHEEGIVHRDLKPENIMVSSAGRVKLMDFGIARLSTSKTITVAGSTMGTVYYMSPEQAAGERADSRSDIFSLGIVLYQMLTGRLPFSGDHPFAVMYSITHEAHRPLTEHGIDLPEALTEVLNRALAKHPDERYTDAAAFREALGSLLEGSERAAGAIPPPGRVLPLRILIPAIAVIVFTFVLIALVFRNGGPQGDRELAERHNETAIALQDSGEVQQARIEFQNAIIADPSYELPWNNLANLAKREGKLEEADSLLREAIERKPDYIAAIYNLADVRWRLNDLEGAERFLRETITADSSFVHAYNNLGLLLLERGLPEEAALVLDSGLSRQWDNPSAQEAVGYLLKNRGLASAQLGDERAETYWNEALEILPGNAEVHQYLAEWYEARGDALKAAVHRRAARERSSPE